eukprot:944133-Pleurochrysis_carterae.AAC.1
MGARTKLSAPRKEAALPALHPRLLAFKRSGHGSSRANRPRAAPMLPHLSNCHKFVYLDFVKRAYESRQFGARVSSMRANLGVRSSA